MEKPLKLTNYKITIIGLGLMGGSLGLAIKRFYPEAFVTGVDLSAQALEIALARGAVDRVTRDLEDGIRGADFIFISTPIHAVESILKKISGKVRAESIVTDLGSTKMQICSTASKAVPKQFVGGHPMTGSEISGMKGSDPYFFQNAIYILTPIRLRDPNVKKLSSFLEKLGAIVLVMPPKLHDEIAAYVSHLPQILAVALTVLISERGVREPFYRELAAGGFRDMTRIASSPYAMWQDIFKSNAEAIRRTLDKLIRNLQEMRNRLGKRSLLDFFQHAAKFREKLPMRRKGFMKPLFRVAVLVPDEPGVLARLTSTVAGQDLNICDIELMKVREGFGGTFQLHFATAEDARGAARALCNIGYESRVVEEEGQKSKK